MPAAWFLLASKSPTGKPKGNLESLPKPTFDSHILLARSSTSPERYTNQTVTPRLHPRTHVIQLLPGWAEKEGKVTWYWVTENQYFKDMDKGRGRKREEQKPLEWLEVMNQKWSRPSMVQQSPSLGWMQQDDVAWYVILKVRVRVGEWSKVVLDGKGHITH
jgi:hypothetical protein